ncbi:hypothetical protein BU24DRAFT_419692 [Aaosphaeria arxii CBS 175.79]|uniref:SRPBCC domain-containing protein n=1 Tax=Aaosphaeria arxii CBS 175.79 TaxID=1450172 RepID=A0A6A5Y5K1_9PLEO|nr:uncharacterized protein BU24DRAFT_419692 [Aaosphaeria arxii CBS 175.79]KAF2020121.1 hypothetical protein BU24DRAFT_419692 [Aaosphaeria arxii CBS 175.79]
MAAVISVKTQVTIKAPAREVWETLIDTSTWPQWNSFIPKAEIVNKQEQPPEGEPQYWKMDQQRKFTAIVAGMKQHPMQKVVAFEEPDPSATGPKAYRICWAVQGYPHFLLNTYRFNEINEVEEEGETYCIYRTGEEQFGPLAHVIKRTIGGQIENGIKAWAEDLKKFMENQPRDQD